MLRILLVSAIAVLPAARAWAVDVTPGGFLVRHELCASLLDVGSWWSDKHRYSGESRGAHARRFSRPNEVLRMGGALGPLQAHGVAGAMTWRLSPTANGTKVDLTYSVGGFMAGGFEAIAPGAPAAK